MKKKQVVEVKQVMDFLTARHVAKMYGLAPLTVLKEIRSGKLRAIRIGHSFRVVQADIDEWLSNSKVSPATKKTKKLKKVKR